MAYPIGGTPYFDAVRHKVELSTPWAEATDRDYRIRDRRDKSYYKLADVWLKNEVEASRLEATDPARAADLYETARQAKEAMTHEAYSDAGRCRNEASPTAG